MNKEKINNFRLISLINPVYMYGRIKAIKSLSELWQRFSDLFILFLKLLTFRYGTAYWEKKRQEKLVNYTEEADKTDEIDVLYEMGEYYFNRKDYEKALKIYNRILELDKDHKPAYLQIGYIEYVKGGYKEALAKYSKALELAKGDKEEGSIIYTKIAQVYLEQGEIYLATEEIKKALEYNENNGYALRALGNMYLRNKEYEKALTQYKKALEIAKGNKKDESMIYSEIAQIHLEQGKPELAIEKIRKSLEYDKNNEYAYITLGNIYRQNKEYEKALAEYKKALELAKVEKSIESEIYSKIAQVHFEQRELDISTQEIRKAINIDKNNEYAYRISGDIYWHKKEYEKSLNSYDKALELAKGNRKVSSEIYSKIAQVYLEQGNYELAIEEARKALAVDDGNAYAHMLLGSSFRYKCMYEGALEELEKALKLSEGNKARMADIYNEITQVHLKQGKYSLAKEEAGKVKDLDPLSKNAHMLSGDIYRQERQYEAALSEFEKALKFTGGDKECECGIYNERAGIYFKQGKYGQGISELKRSVELDPQNGTVHFLMGRGHKYQGRYEEALNEFVKAIGLNKGNKEMEKNLHYEIMKLAEDANINNDEKASVIVKKAIELNCTDNAKNSNILENELEIAQKAVKLKSKVRKLIVSLTNQCNLDCTMCIAQKTPKQEISDKVKEEIKSQFPYLQKINWMGGEVFLYPGFKELMNEAAKHPLEQEITTNGLLIDEGTAAKLIENRVKLMISIDGATKEVYEGIRRGARFELLIQRLKMFNELRDKIDPGYCVAMNVVVTRSNYHQIKAITEFAGKYKFNNINIMLISENRNNENIFSYDPDDEVLCQVSKALDEARESCEKYGIEFNNNITKEITEINNKMKTGIAVQYDENPLKADKGKTGNKNVICLAPWETLNISMTGEVSPRAHCLCKNVIGNLNESSLEEVWNGERMVRYRQQIVSGNIEKVCTLKEVYKKLPSELSTWQR